MNENRAEDSAIALVAELEDALRLTRMYLQAKGGYARAADAEYVEAALARASAWRRGAAVPPSRLRPVGAGEARVPEVAPLEGREAAGGAEETGPRKPLPTRDL